MADAKEEAGGKKAKIILIAGLAVLTLVGAGGGWVLGGLIAPEKSPEELRREQIAAKPETGKKDEGLPKISTVEKGVVLLDPITTNLAYPSENWIRLEVALAFKAAPELPLAEAIHQDIMAYMRTVSLQQIEGPRGFQYLKEDLRERVALRSQGKIADIMFRSFVIE